VGEIIGKRAGDFEMFRSRLDRAKGDCRPIVARHEKRRHRGKSGHEHRLPLQRLRRCFAVATAILDRKPPTMEKAAALRDIRHLDTGGALQQFTPRPIEIDVAKRGTGRLAEKGQKLPLQGPAGNAGDCGEFRHAPAVPDIGMHRIEGAPNAARQWRCRR
jgi:hypothetical protein